MFPLLALALALAPAAAAPLPDWLNSDVSALTQPSFTDNGDGTWTLGNGLISRTFRYGGAPGTGFGTLDFFSHTSQTSLLRAIDCEGYVTLSNATYALGSLIQTGTQYHAYLNRSADGVNFNPAGFDAASHTLAAPMAPFPWTPGTRGSPATAQWPPPGLQVAFQLRAPAAAPAALQAVAVQLVFEVYPGMPLITKYVTIASAGPAAAGLVIAAVTTETLHLARQYTPWELGAQSPAGAGSWAGTGGAQLYVQSDAAHGSQVQWLADGAQPTDPGAVEAVLAVSYSTGPGVVLQGGGGGGGARRRAPLHATRVGGDAAAVAEFVSFRTFLLVTDTTDAERAGMAVKRLYRLWAPHAQENPLFFHATDTSAAGFRLEVDQMAAVGFEMLIYSFGSGFNLETADPAYLAQVKQQVAYAQSKGIEVGGYDLICLDRGHGGYGGNVGDQWDAVAGDGSLTQDACFASGWVDKLNDFAYGFINETGLSMLETDGPYGGGACASANHSHHLQLSDSVYQQNMQQASWYSGLRARNVYINQPDSYFFQGGQRTGLGYDEDQYSLPRWQDLTCVARRGPWAPLCDPALIHATPPPPHTHTHTRARTHAHCSVSRMTVYDQTYAKIPTSGWMFVPLQDYHGGGAAAAFEPMSQHLAEYEIALAQYMGAGIAACYRGFRLYDAPAAQAVVAKWVAIYKAHRDIITSDIVHIRRPDGQALDAFMHVNHALKEKAMALVFNPTLQTLNQSITFPLYYTGLTDSALFSREGAAPTPFALARDYSVTFFVAVAPQSATWFLVTAAQ